MKTKVVKFLKYHPQFAHEVGDVAELVEKDADFLTENGLAELIEKEKAEKATVDTAKAEKATK